MQPSPLTDCSRLCIHTVTTKPWSIEESAANYAAAGVGGITVWRDSLNGHAAPSAGRMLRENGLDIVSYVRGGFFTDPKASAREASIDDNKRMIDEAAELGAPLIVLVVGASPKQPMCDSRRQIEDGLAAILPHAEAAGVKLGIEPLHPVYADNRSAINTLAHANDVVEHFAHPSLGVVLDVYHVWWDPNLQAEIQRCGRNNALFAFHVCDWKTPTEHILLDRGLMGEGCIALREIRGWVEDTGFDGPIEVEIFSERYWRQDQHDFLRRICDATLTHV